MCLNIVCRFRLITTATVLFHPPPSGIICQTLLVAYNFSRFYNRPGKIGIHIAVIGCISRLPAENRWPTQIRIICDKFNKGTIYRSVIRVREIPSIACLGLITVSLFVTGRRMEREGRGETWAGQGGLFEDATTGVESFYKQMRLVPPNPATAKQGQ